MDVNIIDTIPDNKPHCGNCNQWDNIGELFGNCKLNNKRQPSFGMCDSYQKNIIPNNK